MRCATSCATTRGRPGVRKLEQTIGTVCRKQARRVVEGHTEKLVVTRETLKEFLGGIQVRVDTEVAERVKRPGVAVGLAWTPAGGDILFIEANKMKGKGGFTMTGQIGEVMQESMQAALTWVRSNAAEPGAGRGLYQGDRPAHSRAGGRDSQGRAFGRRDHGHGAGVAADRYAGASADGHDRRDHAERQRAAGGRHQGEVSGGAPGGSGNHHPARGEPPERGRGPDAGDDGGRDGALRQPHRGRAGRGAAAAEGAAGQRSRPCRGNGSRAPSA